MVDLFQNIKIKKDSKILDTCVGPGFFTKELIESGYNISTMDISDENVKPFLEDMKSLGLKHEVKKCSWLDIDKNFKEGEFDFVYNRGNSFIFANGGLLENKNINKKETLSKMKETLVKYYKVLKPGGYLYLDKYKDSEVPSEKIVAKLNIEKEKKTKDVVFYVERNPDKGYRYASIILRDEQGDNSTVFNKVYDLTESELENLLREVGFKFKRLNLKSEKHFVVWLAQK
jgi:SAM-dependent methyltransferase